MSPDPSTPTDLPHDLQELRARAEERRQLVTQAGERHTPEELQRLVEELQVHQIELEMQYEELLLAQAELQEVRAEYVDLYDFAPVSYFTLSADGTIEQLNLCAARQLGSTRQHLQGRLFALFIDPTDLPEFGQFMDRVFAHEHSQRQELRLRRENNSLIYAQLEALRLDGATGPQCRLVVVDVTERRAAQVAQAASEARFRATFEQSNDGMVLLDGYQCADLNAASVRLLGLPRKEEALGKSVLEFWPERQPGGHFTIDHFETCFRQATQSGWCRIELLRRHPAGRDVWDELSFNPVQVQGRPFMHAVWRDATATRAAREQLRYEKEFSESLLQNSIDGIFAIDQQLRFTSWNQRATQFAHLEKADVLGRSLYEVYPEYNTPATAAMLAQVLAGEQLALHGQQFKQWAGLYDAFLMPLKDEHGQVTGILGTIRDVTERTQLSEEATQLRLRQQQEVLAAILETQESERKRIAEALHNGLGQLLYAAKLSLEGRPGAPASPRQTLRLLEEAIRTTRTISFELTPGILEDFGLRTALEEMIKRISPNHLPVRLQLRGLEQRLPAPVEIAVYRIIQELLNNVLKHAEAIEVSIQVVRKDDQLQVKVEDNGQGFEPKVLALQPLAGIGLAGIGNRVALLGGTFELDSTPGKGTAAAITLTL